jgi:hypothetical protein
MPWCKIAYTLVSVGNLDDEGFIIKFGTGKCEITNPDGIVVGVVPKSKKGQYRVEHYLEMADADFHER